MVTMLCLQVAPEQIFITACMQASLVADASDQRTFTTDLLFGEMSCPTGQVPSLLPHNKYNRWSVRNLCRYIKIQKQQANMFNLSHEFGIFGIVYTTICSTSHYQITNMCMTHIYSIDNIISLKILFAHKHNIILYTFIM